jgi:hypothetical protein
MIFLIFKSPDFLFINFTKYKPALNSDKSNTVLSLLIVKSFFVINLPLTSSISISNDSFEYIFTILDVIVGKQYKKLVSFLLFNK